MKKLLLSIVFSISISISIFGQWKGKPADFSNGRLKASDNKRFLQHENGTPFFYLGDTAWELFHRLNKFEADTYLIDRANKGYTVIQAVALAEIDGHLVPNAYEYLPLIDLDPAHPDIKDGTDNDYWDFVDYVVDKANSLGMYIGFLPTWGRFWHDGDKPMFNAENARKYGEFIGNRYKDKQIIWILGGDRGIDNDVQREIIRAMVKGLKEGDGGTHLMTFHPPGANGSSTWFHNEEWLDFNMRQNGHTVEYTDRYSKTLDDYNRTPVKPVIDGEPVYEDHPVDFNAPKRGHSISSDVRAAMYWNLFNGAFGHAYGHHSVWQMYDPDKGQHPVNNPLMSWKEAISQPGSLHMMYGRMLMESRPFLTRIPAPSIIVTDKVSTSVPGEGRYKFVATCDEGGTYAMVYVPVGRRFSIRMNAIKGDKIKAWWYNPRNGKAASIGTFENNGKERAFISPDKGEMIDWILVLDNADCKYPAPGKKL